MAKKEAKKAEVVEKIVKEEVKEEKLIRTKDAQGRTWLVDAQGKKIKRA
jgi:hypothetical protein